MQKCLSKKNQKIASCRQLFVCAANIPRLLKITDYFLLVCRNIKLSVRALKFAFLKEKKSSLLHDNGWQYGMKRIASDFLSNRDEVETG